MYLFFLVGLLFVGVVLLDGRDEETIDDEVEEEISHLQQRSQREGGSMFGINL